MHARSLHFFLGPGRVVCWFRAMGNMHDNYTVEKIGLMKPKDNTKHRHEAGGHRRAKLFLQHPVHQNDLTALHVPAVKMAYGPTSDQKLASFRGSTFLQP